MEKVYTNLRGIPVGMYVTDATTLAHHRGAESYWITHKEFNYVPILRMLNISNDNEIRLASGERIEEDITSYNQNYRLTMMDEAKVEKTKLNVTTNDLLVNTIDIALNFTGKRVTIVGHRGGPKSYAPLKLEPMHEFQGKLLFLTLYTLNSKESIHRVYGLVNYISHLRNRLADKRDINSCELKDVYEYVLDCYANTKTGVILDSTDTYKIATIGILDTDRVKKFGDPDTTIHIRNRQLEVSFCEILTAPVHDVFSQNYSQDVQIMDTIREHGRSYFIVDNNDKISDRFMYIAGKVMKVPKQKNPDRLCGFYDMHIDGKKSLSADDFTPIENLDSLDYLYKTEEEALYGANKKEIYKDTIELKKLDKVNESIELKSETEVVSAELLKQRQELELIIKKRLADMDEQYRTKQQARDEEDRKNKLRYEEEIRKLKLRHEEDMLQYKRDSENAKRQTEDHKFNYERNRYQMDNLSLYSKREYEVGKYERDSTIETIKTVGGIVGLIAGGVVLYGKMAGK